MSVNCVSPFIFLFFSFFETRGTLTNKVSLGINILILKQEAREANVAFGGGSPLASLSLSEQLRANHATRVLEELARLVLCSYLFPI